MIRKLLVANRGEIAVRIIRGAREMGVRTVAVFSEADRHSAHVRLADESVEIGGSAPSESYLNITKILDAAFKCGADAIHPGYGFLSERAEFSESCHQNGLIFVGPPASAMRMLGTKSDAKTLASQIGVPIVPGCFEPGADAETLRLAAETIGYPVMLKASAGGGGRGMRVLRDSSHFLDELQTASDEALKSFGDGSMMVEKLVERPRHVEVQVLSDTHGNVVCLFERECSLQRRHQKLVEEAPSPYLANHPEMWQEMATAVRKLVRASGYVGAGTVEFMVDEPSGKFYFLEVNTRLQVEHPVTEAITSVDLVHWQLKIASGEVLALSDQLVLGERTAISGHSIEARIVAEDPSNGFAPSIGKITGWALPTMPGVRIDTGFGEGSEITRFYDSLIAKVIVHAESRTAAVVRLRAALLDFHVLGVKTNIGYLLDVLAHPDFVAGQIDTGFLGRNFGEWKVLETPPQLAEILKHATFERKSNSANQGTLPNSHLWGMSDAFRNVSSQ